MVLQAKMNDVIDKIYLSQDYDQTEVTDYTNHNTDVVVLLASGKKYIATFFTYQNIKQLQLQNKESGAFLSGKYFWTNNMLLIDECSLESVSTVVEELLEEGEFHNILKA